MLNLEPTLLSNVVEMHVRICCLQRRAETDDPMQGLAGVPTIEADALRLHQVL